MDSRASKTTRRLPWSFRNPSAGLPRRSALRNGCRHVGHPLYLSFKHAALPRAFRGHHAFRGPFRDLPRNLVHLFTPSADNNNVRCKVPMLERLKKTQLRWNRLPMLGSSEQVDRVALEHIQDCGKIIISAAF